MPERQHRFATILNGEQPNTPRTIIHPSTHMIGPFTPSVMSELGKIRSKLTAVGFKNPNKR